MTIDLLKGQEWLDFEYPDTNDNISGKLFTLTRNEDNTVTFSINAESNLNDRSDTNNKADFIEFEGEKKEELQAVIICNSKLENGLRRWLKSWGIEIRGAATLSIIGSETHIFEIPNGFSVDGLGSLVLRIK